MPGGSFIGAEPFGQLGFVEKHHLGFLQWRVDDQRSDLLARRLIQLAAVAFGANKLINPGTVRIGNVDTELIASERLDGQRFRFAVRTVECVTEATVRRDRQYDAFAGIKISFG